MHASHHDCKHETRCQTKREPASRCLIFLSDCKPLPSRGYPSKASYLHFYESWLWLIVVTRIYVVGGRRGDREERGGEILWRQPQVWGKYSLHWIHTMKNREFPSIPLLTSSDWRVFLEDLEMTPSRFDFVMSRVIQSVCLPTHSCYVRKINAIYKAGARSLRTIGYNLGYKHG